MSSPILTTASLPSFWREPSSAIDRPSALPGCVPAERVIKRQSGNFQSAQSGRIHPVLTHEFIRRFLLHTLPDAFHRIRHYGFLANGHRAAKLALCRKLLAAPTIEPVPPEAESTAFDRCPCCGGVMVTVAILPRPSPPRPPFRQDTS